MTYFVEKTSRETGGTTYYDVVADGVSARVLDNGALLIEDVEGTAVSIYPSGEWTAAFKDKQVHRRTTQKTFATFDIDDFGQDD